MRNKRQIDEKKKHVKISVIFFLHSNRSLSRNAFSLNKTSRTQTQIRILLEYVSVVEFTSEVDITTVHEHCFFVQEAGPVLLVFIKQIPRRGDPTREVLSLEVLFFSSFYKNVSRRIFSSEGNALLVSNLESFLFMLPFLVHLSQKCCLRWDLLVASDSLRVLSLEPLARNIFITNGCCCNTVCFFMCCATSSPTNNFFVNPAKYTNSTSQILPNVKYFVVFSNRTNPT